MYYHIYLEQFSDVEKTNLISCGYFINSKDLAQHIGSNVSQIHSFNFVKKPSAPLNKCSLKRGKFSKDQILLDIIDSKYPLAPFLSRQAHHGKGHCSSVVDSSRLPPQQEQAHQTLLS